MLMIEYIIQGKSYIKQTLDRFIIDIIQLMVYGKILYNNIKEYTPKWFPTIPYSQTVKHTFGRKPQVAWDFNKSDAGKSFWRNFAFVFQRHSFMWQFVIVAFAFVGFHVCYDPILFLYRSNNKHRTYKAAIEKEKAHKKKLKQQEAKESGQGEAASE